MSLMSHMGFSTVPPSAQVGGRMGHVGHDLGPFLTWPSPLTAASCPGGGGCIYPPPPGDGYAGHWHASRRRPPVPRLVTGRHPPPPARHPMEFGMPVSGDPVRLALELAALGWHILPLSATSKRPLSNCPACRTQHGTPGHLPEACPCLAGGGWCHGVRAATTDPA